MEGKSLTNGEIADAFSLLGDLLELEGGKDWVRQVAVAAAGEPTPRSEASA